MTLHVRALLLLSLLAFLAGCGSTAPAAATPEVAKIGPATSFYVTQVPSLSQGLGPTTALQFAVSAGGAIQPAATLALPLSTLFQAIAVNTFGHLFAGGFRATGATGTAVVYEFASGATGAATPLRQLLIPSSANPEEIAFDASNNVYVGSDTEIDVFAPGATTPSRTISGALTQLADIGGIAADSSGQIFVTSGFLGARAVLVFSPTATGNVAPVRTIVGTGNAAFFSPAGIAFDPAGNLFVSDVPQTSSPVFPTIYEFAPGTATFPMPLKTIAGPATGLHGVGSLRIDLAGNLFVFNITLSAQTGAASQPSMLMFTPGATGNAAPVATVASSAWTYVGTGQMGIY